MRRLVIPALFVLVVASTGLGAGETARRKVIIDQDAFGGVNLQPLLMILQAKDVEVLGITIESGDGWQKESVAHTLRLLELIGRTDVPVVPGATYPLINSEEATRRWETIYGKVPYKGAWMDHWPDYNTVNRPHYHAADVVPPLEEGEPTTKPAPEIAAEFLVRQIRRFPGEVTIVALGPFTNIALAAKLDEGFAAGAKELLFMGGSFNPSSRAVDEFSLQFINRPREEFNSWWDPEAAKIMLHAPWRKITAVPTDATVGTKLTPALAKEAGSTDSPVARYFKKYGEVGFPMWDETAAAVWLDPTLVTRSEQLAMDIDIDHGANYGATLSWPADFAPGLGEPRVTVVRAIDIPRLERMFVSLIQSPNPTP
jgi:inosine-uridine nucleoside N-ribohydrolase